MGTAENYFVLCQSNPAWFHFRRFGGKSAKKKKTARILQGSAVILDGEIVRLPTKSLVGAEAIMLTNMGSWMKLGSTTGWYGEASQPRVFWMRPNVYTLCVRCKCAESLWDHLDSVWIRVRVSGQMAVTVGSQSLGLHASREGASVLVEWKRNTGHGELKKGVKIMCVCSVNGGKRGFQQQKSGTLSGPVKDCHQLTFKTKEQRERVTSSEAYFHQCIHKPTWQVP